MRISVVLSVRWLGLLAVLGSCSTCQADDQVTLRPKNSVGTFTLVGSIADYTGRELTIRPKGGGELKRYPSSDVQQIQTPYTAPHHQALRQLAAENWEEAQVHLSQALDQEDRVWVRRELLAHQVRVALQTKDWFQAASRFALIMDSDSESIHRDLAPLCWTGFELSPEAEAQTRLWLRHPVAMMRLVAVSARLEGAEPDLQEALRGLKRSEQPLVQRLAQAQEWRMLATQPQLTGIAVSRWELAVETLPPSFRAGPFFVVGLGYRSLQEHDRAAVCFLWGPLMQSPDRRLREACAELAADSLEAAGQTAAGEQIRQEFLLPASP